MPVADEKTSRLQWHGSANQPAEADGIVRAVCIVVAVIMTVAGSGNSGEYGELLWER